MIEIIVSKTTWRNFIADIHGVGFAPNTEDYVIRRYDKLKQWGGHYERPHGLGAVLSFENERDSTVFLLRWM